jgi:hypothetical protein
MGEKDGSCLTIREPNIPYSIINQDAATIRCFLTTLLKHSVTDQGEKILFSEGLSSSLYIIFNNIDIHQD